MGLKIKGDIETVHRLGNKMAHKPRDLIIKFKTTEVRQEFYQNRKKTSLGKDPRKNIYINDHITDYRKGLFYEARKLYRANKVIAAWTQSGNVLIRKNCNERPIQISSYEDLQEVNNKTAMVPDKDPVSSTILETESIKSHLSDYEIFVDPYSDCLCE